MKLTFLKYTFFFLLIFLLGAGNTIAKPTPIPSQKYTIAKTVIGKAFAMANIALPSLDIILNNTDLKI